MKHKFVLSNKITLKVKGFYACHLLYFVQIMVHLSEKKTKVVRLLSLLYSRVATSYPHCFSSFREEEVKLTFSAIFNQKKISLHLKIYCGTVNISVLSLLLKLLHSCTQGRKITIKD